MFRTVDPEFVARFNEPKRVHMDPNSQHQMWSLWAWKVVPERKQLVMFGGTRKRGPTVAEVKDNLLRFGNKCFGDTGQMHIEQYADGTVLIKCRVEGHPVHDAAYVQHVRQNWDKFLRNGFGQRSNIKFEAKLEAGNSQDGKPADQLIILPPFHVGVEQV